MKSLIYRTAAACLIVTAATTLVATQARSADLPGTNPALVRIDMKVEMVPTDVWDKIPDSDKATQAQLLTIIQKNLNCIIESPSMVTVSNVCGSISIGSQIPYGTNTVGVGQAPKYNFLEVGTVTKVTPCVNPNGSIAVQFNFTDSQLVKSVKGTATSPDAPPAVNTLSVTSQYLVSNGVPSAFKVDLGESSHDKVCLIEITATSK